MFTLPIGTVSHGTLRNADLLDSFAYELSRIVRKADAEQDTTTAARLLAEYNAMIAESDDSEDDSEDESEIDLETEEASDLVNEMIDEFDNWTPPYCYFGTLEGDGSDFGVWPSLESVFEDVTRIDDPADLDNLPADESEAVFVNDHGNVTLYGRNATGEFAIVWDIV